MSQNPSPARPGDPAHEAPARTATPASGGDTSSQVWKFIALGLGVILLGVLLFSWYPGSQPDQAQAPADEQQQVIEDEQAQQEEEAAQEEKDKEKRAPAPAPPPVADDPRPSSRPSAGGGGGSDGLQQPSLPPALSNVHILSVGYSTLPSRRVVALRIGGGLPYFLREGDTIGDMKILSIMTDRVQVSQNGKTYDIVVQ